MVPYHFKVHIPSLDKKVSFHDITIRDLININKSILNNDYDEIIECFDLIIDSCCLDSGTRFTLIDKMIILLSIRSYSISNFCRSIVKDPEVGGEFEYTLEINNIISNLLKLDVEHKRAIHTNDVCIEYGVPVYPITNTHIISPSEFIHCIKYKDEVIITRDKHNAPDILEILQNTDIDVYDSIVSYANVLLSKLQDSSLYRIPSSYDLNKIIIEQKMVLDVSIYNMLKLLYTENLHTLYRSIYSFNKNLNIPPTYTENLIPVEKDLLWGYYVKDQQDAIKEQNAAKKTGSFTM